MSTIWFQQADIIQEPVYPTYQPDWKLYHDNCSSVVNTGRHYHSNYSDIVNHHHHHHQTVFSDIHMSDWLYIPAPPLHNWLKNGVTRAMRKDTFCNFEAEHHSWEHSTPLVPPPHHDHHLATLSLLDLLLGIAESFCTYSCQQITRVTTVEDNMSQCSIIIYNKHPVPG